MSTPESSASRRTATTHEQRECIHCNGLGLVLLDASYWHRMLHLPGQRQRVGLPVLGAQAKLAWMIEVYTSHWRSPLLKDVDAVIVSISRGQPRWKLPFRYRRLDELAPDDATRAQADEQEYEASYARQLEEIGAEAILARMKQISDNLSAVLLCWEKPGDWCHRRMLADYIEQEGRIVVPELRAGMLGKRPDAQQALFD